MDHGGCALQVGTKGDKIVAVKRDPAGYLSQGYVCPKGVASPDRLTFTKKLGREFGSLNLKGINCRIRRE